MRENKKQTIVFMIAIAASLWGICSFSSSWAMNEENNVIIEEGRYSIQRLNDSKPSGEIELSQSAPTHIGLTGFKLYEDSSYHSFVKRLNQEEYGRVVNFILLTLPGETYTFNRLNSQKFQYGGRINNKGVLIDITLNVISKYVAELYIEDPEGVSVRKGDFSKEQSTGTNCIRFLLQKQFFRT